MANSVVFILFCFFLSGAKGRMKLKREYVQLDQQAEIINKPAIKSFKENYSSYANCDSYDCLANLTISKSHRRISGYPPGTVPFRSMKEDLVRLKSLSMFGGESTITANSISPPGTHWAVLISNKGKYRGASAWFDVHNVSGVELNQYSGAAIAIINGLGGPRDNYNVIIAGWFVHPSLYGDNLPRLTIFWTTDGYQKSFCFNRLCPEFSQKNYIYVPGMTVHEYYRFHLSLYMDEQTGDWCLSTNIENRTELIGCWPKSTFTSLGDHAEFVEWGGLVQSPPERVSPPMGNGKYPEFGARVTEIHVVDEWRKSQGANGKIYSSNRTCYDAARFKKRIILGWSFFYGGPGGCLG